MIKKEFVEKFSDATGENKKRSKELIEAFLKLSTDVMAEEGELQFVGWGGFHAKETPSRMVKHPKTGDEIIIPAKKVVKFKLGKNLTQRLLEASLSNTTKSRFSINRVIKKLGDLFGKS